MKALNLYYIGKSLHNFRRNEPAKIIGIKSVQPDEKSTFRNCFEVEYEDGVKDFKAIDEGEYELKTLEEIIKEKNEKGK